MEFERSTSTLERESFDYRGSAGEPIAEIIGRQRSSPAYYAPDDDNALFAVFCFEDAASPIGRQAARTAAALAKRGHGVHLFSQRPFELDGSAVIQHTTDDCGDGDLLDNVHQFAHRACNRFLSELGNRRTTTILGYEWPAVPALSMLRGLKNLPCLLSLQSLERQRSDMSSDLSKQIDEIERTGLREAKGLLIHDSPTADLARQLAPECSARLVAAHAPFAVEPFQTRLDPGEVKARYQIGPVDPTILYIGDLADSYGPDMVVRALPAVLKNHPQARLAIVGQGDLYWPMRVYARYLLVEHAVRLIGDLRGNDLSELIAAADVVVVPSRQSTPWWPIQAAWAARRPVVATHHAAPPLLAHEQDSVLFYPSIDSCVWGIERVLFDPALGQAIAERGHAKLEQRFGWNAVAQQIEELAGIRQEDGVVQHA